MKHHEIEVWLEDDEIKLDRETLTMTTEDSLAWRLRDPGDGSRPRFAIEFKSGTSPFNGADHGRHQGSMGWVKAGRPHGTAATYKYTIIVDDRTLDPTIIIEEPPPPPRNP